MTVELVKLLKTWLFFFVETKKNHLFYVERLLRPSPRIIWHKNKYPFDSNALVVLTNIFIDVRLLALQ